MCVDILGLQGSGFRGGGLEFKFRVLGTGSAWGYVLLECAVRFDVR